jgi:hypothetical protein
MVTIMEFWFGKWKIYRIPERLLASREALFFMEITG